MCWSRPITGSRRGSVSVSYPDWRRSLRTAGSRSRRARSLPNVALSAPSAQSLSRPIGPRKRIHRVSFKTETRTDQPRRVRPDSRNVRGCRAEGAQVVTSNTFHSGTSLLCPGCLAAGGDVTLNDSRHRRSLATARAATSGNHVPRGNEAGGGQCDLRRVPRPRFRQKGDP
jgi:hypothetical protein